jgi:hypothetical protein
MQWEQILGFFTMWLHPEVTVGLWSKAGVPIWQTYLYTTLWTSATLIVTYFGAGWLKNWLCRQRLVREVIRLIEKQSLGNSIRAENSKHHKRILNLLVRQKNWLILVCGFIPFVYGLPAAVIVATKLMNIKYALPFLLAGNIFRNGMICFLVYQGVRFLS